MSKVLLIDNYDSFTYNLYHYLEELCDETIEVVRNDQIDLEKLDQYEWIVISPGPGLPKEAGSLMAALERIKSSKHILGICLGMQALGQVFGSKLSNLSEVVHGQSSLIEILDRDGLYKDLPQEITVGRYHSWVIDTDALSKELEVTALDKNGNVMSLKHKKLPINAVQYHPESILSNYGKEILKNWLRIST